MPDTFVVNVSKDKAIEAAAAAYIPDGQVTIPFSPMIINTGSKLIAIDTGNGLGAFASSNGTVGQARSNMEAAGIDPKQVDIVLISHFHGDHIGGLKNADGSAAFPNAEIKVPAIEADFWADDGHQSKANGFNKAQFGNVKKMMEGLKVTPYEADKEVAPGVTSLAGPHVIRCGVRFVPHSRTVGCDQHSVILPEASRLARLVRQRPSDCCCDASQGLRHGSDRENAGDRLSFPVSLRRSCGEGWLRLPTGAGSLPS